MGNFSSVKVNGMYHRCLDDELRNEMKLKQIDWH